MFPLLIWTICRFFHPSTATNKWLGVIWTAVLTVYSCMYPLTLTGPSSRSISSSVGSSPFVISNFTIFLSTLIETIKRPFFVHMKYSFFSFALLFGYFFSINYRSMMSWCIIGICIVYGLFTSDFPTLNTNMMPFSARPKMYSSENLKNLMIELLLSI